MELEFKQNFDKVQKRWAAFWKEENKAPLVSIEFPKEGVEPIEKPVLMSGYDGNFKPVIEQLIGWAQTHDFLGDSIPYFYLTFGADHVAALFGADLKFDFDAETSWCIPFVKDWDSVEIKFNPDCFWFDRTIRFLRELRRECDGRLMIAGPTLPYGLDILAAIRGPENLLMDMAIEPETIKALEKDVCKTYKKISDVIFDELGYKDFGSINRHGMYSLKKTDVIQCDISCMIGPDMYQNFALPYTRHDADYLDDVEYHLDGPGALKHLETLCAVDNVDVIQWVPGAGEAETTDWTNLHVKIDQLGKGQVLYKNPQQARKLLKLLKSKKLFFKLTADSRKEAEEFIEEMGGIL